MFLPVSSKSGGGQRGGSQKNRGWEGYEGRGRKAREVKVLERVGSRRNRGDYATMPC